MNSDARLKVLLITSRSTDMKQLGHGNRQKLMEEVLTLMAREKHSPEVLHYDKPSWRIFHMISSGD